MPAPTSSAGRPGVRPLLDDLAASCRTVVRILIGSTLALALGAVVFLGAGVVTGGWRLLPVLSGSMQPTIGEGDAVLVSRAPVSSVRVGDVIAYRIPIGDRHLTTHRVVSVLEHGDRPIVRTRGDANAIEDPWTARLSGDALWRVDATVPHVGDLYGFAGDRLVRMLALWVAVAVTLGIALRRLWRRGRLDVVANT